MSDYFISNDMRQIALRHVRKFSRQFSWKSTTNNDVVFPTCNGNLNSHIVQQTEINVLHKYLARTVNNDNKDGGLNKKNSNNDACNKADSGHEDHATLFSVLLKFMKTRLNEILNTISREPECLIKYVSWKIRELLLCAIITTGVSCCPESNGRSAAESCLYRCSGALSGYFFSRQSMFTLGQSLKSSLAKSATLGVYSNFVSRLHASNSIRAKCDVKACPPVDKPPGMKGAEGTTKEKLFKPLTGRTVGTSQKVSVVGIGQVGMAAIISMLTQGVTNEIAMIDVNADKLKGESLDLLHGSIFVNNPKIEGSTDFSVCSGSKICVICAGVRQRDKETRLDLVKRNTAVVQKMVPELMKHIPNAVFIIATNPVDVLTYVFWKISGLPRHQVVGSGTLLDSARFRYLISQRLGIAATSIDAYIIGEHGNSMVPVWSAVNVAGVRLREIHSELGRDLDPEKWKEIHETLLKSAYYVRSMKGFTSWAIGLSLSKMVQAMLTNSNRVFTVSTYVKGMQGIEDEVYLSLPSVLCRNGVSDIINQVLSEREKKLLHKSAKIMAAAVSDLKL